MQYLISHKYLSDMLKLDFVKAAYASQIQIEIENALEALADKNIDIYRKADVSRVLSAVSWALYNRGSIVPNGSLAIRGVNRPSHTVDVFMVLSSLNTVVGHVNVWRGEEELSDIMTQPFRVIL